MDKIKIYTVGHSNKTLPDFLGMLKAYSIETLADVRRFPGSKKYPHFSQEALQRELAYSGIDYVHMPDLGGRRKADPDSKNTVWRNEAFRGYADYMETEAFGKALTALLEIAQQKTTAIMCSEAVWWRCHRSLISDKLKSMGHDVIHILSPKKSEMHPYTSAAKIVNGKLSYRGEQYGLFDE